MDQQNVYLEQVMQRQAEVDQDLKRKTPVGRPRAAASRGGPADEEPTASVVDLGEASRSAIDYRITGAAWWKSVVVPPNVYVIHTRRGHEAPLHMGLGTSFRYRPRVDSFLLIPAAVQTLLISANCICRERQGILVQAYVQWVIGDLSTAYRKLDFSHPEDPMKIVNVQLREQAEAAIKDKVATLSIDDVLSDKQPIIEELTHRLRAVAEGTGHGEGLGLKIVTVQIKEAVVSSTTVWENLQKPFRAERQKVARVAELEAQRDIAARELENRRAASSAQIEADEHVARMRHDSERADFDRKREEEVRRGKLGQEEERRAIADRSATELARREADLSLRLDALRAQVRELEQEAETLAARRKLDESRREADRVAAEAEVAISNLQHGAEADRAARDLEVARTRREIENDVTPNHLAAQLVAKLHEIAREIPKPAELRAVTIGGDEVSGPLSPLLRFLAAARQLVPEWITKGSGSKPDASG